MTSFTLPNLVPSRLLKTLPTPNFAKIIQFTEPKLPFIFRKKVAEQLLNYLFKEQLQDDEFYFLEGQELGLEVRDLGIQVAFTCQDEELIVLPAQQPNAWIRGDAVDFIKMASQEVDPDTLFFQRKLVIEGNTELGLAIKNLMDSVDWSEMPTLFQRSIQFARRATK